MLLNFYKYHGSGNDFVIIDNRQLIFPANNQALIKSFCNRNFGIGADGMMLLEEKPGYDFHMRYFNSDGRESTMCGNGGRCIVHFARELAIITDSAIFSGIDGGHEARIDERELVHLKMQDVDKIERDGPAYIINTGSPHYVLFTDNIDHVDVVKTGRQIRYSELYKNQGINVNFVETSGDCIRIRTYERGVENETLACGTGSVAAVLSFVLETETEINRIKIETRGGMLEVGFRQRGKSAFRDIWLTGPAKQVFHGKINTQNLSGSKTEST